MIKLIANSIEFIKTDGRGFEGNNNQNSNNNSGYDNNNDDSDVPF
jgi:hypothetical protein